VLSSILDIHGEGMLGNGSFHSELVLLTLCSLEITCSFVFDSYHFYQTTAGRRYSYSVVVDVTGMHIDVLCLYMTGLHIFSLCSGFVCAVIHHRHEFIRLPGKLFPLVLFLPSNDCFSTEKCAAIQSFLCSIVHPELNVHAHVNENTNSNRSYCFG